MGGLTPEQLEKLGEVMTLFGMELITELEDKADEIIENFCVEKCPRKTLEELCPSNCPIYMLTAALGEIFTLR